jgi:hypothetical protein
MKYNRPYEIVSSAQKQHELGLERGRQHNRVSFANDKDSNKRQNYRQINDKITDNEAIVLGMVEV